MIYITNFLFKTFLPSPSYNGHVRLAGGWLLMLVCSERNTTAGLWLIYNFRRYTILHWLKIPK
jgi:hypothetical protein